MKRKSTEEQNDSKSGDFVQEELVIPVIEEEVVIGKKILSKGGVIVSKEVITEEISVDTPVVTEHIDIERIPVNEYRESRPGIRHEGDTMIIPVLQEVIEKRVILVEEIRITKRETSETRKERITLSREKVNVREKG